MGFYGLEIAKTGLYVSQTALEVIGHNISNAATKGYTRQRVITQSVDAAMLNTRFSKVVTGSVGGGVELQSVSQIRSDYIDRELRREYAALGEWKTHAETLEYIESLFDETSDNSISSALADFYNSLSDLSTDPASMELRTNVQQNSIKMTDTLNHYYTQLTELQNEQNESMYTMVQSINDLLTNIGDYNSQIYAYELSGEPANDLRDKRNLVLDELSQLVNIEYGEGADGKLTVSVQGQALVNHNLVTKIEAAADQTGAVSGETGYYSFYLEGTATAFEYSGGSLKACIFMRDGNSVDEIGIPRLLSGLNKLCQSLAEEFNAVHNDGYTMPSGSTASQTGIDFFNVPSGDYSLITAGHFRLSDAILEDVNNIAASSQMIDLAASNTQEGNNENILALYALSSSDTIEDIGNFEDYLKSIISEIAIDSAHGISMYESQATVVENLENRKESTSGVSIDEEMIDMIKYQHAYSAASRLITAIDETLDTLVNKTGIVGR
ncbi:MAG: flagellar hook-associated protein FlgK [Christensenellales bacterium]